MRTTSYAGEALVLLMMMLYFLGVVASFGVLIAEELENLIGQISKKEWLLAFAPVMILMSQLPNVTAVAKMTPLAVLCILILVSATSLRLRVEEGRQGLL